MPRMRPRLTTATAVGAALFGATALAQPAEVAAQAEAGRGQAALAVGFDARGELVARVCARGPCALAGGENLELPADYKTRRKGAKLQVVPVGEGRRAVLVEVPGPILERSWKALVVAPLAGTAPKVLFRGETGYVSGEWGERHGPMVQLSDARDDGSRAIVVGEQREDLALCGRPTVLAPQLLVARDLTLKPAKVQRLTPKERDAAQRLSAVRRSEDDTSKPLPLLRARGASSAVGNPSALTDGDPESYWSENRGGDGRGELVVMSAPRELPITGFELLVRPPTANIAAGAAPREVFLATEGELFHVTLPEDAWKHPGARYRVDLPKGVRTDCVALVLDTAYEDKKLTQVTIAELAAYTELDDTSLDALVGALAGGGERAQSAAAALALLGETAQRAVAAAFERLDEGGRRVALTVMDHGPCDLAAPTYVDAVLGPFDAQRKHARERLRRCSAEGALAVKKRIESDPARLGALAAELAALDPAGAVEKLVPRLGKAKTSERLAIRVALGRASRDPGASGAVRAALSSSSLSRVGALDLLRSLGERANDFNPEASVALSRLADPKASFRERYLRLEPAAVLAQSDPTAARLLSQAITAEADPHVRARAAELVREPTRFRTELLAALEDSEMRVRESAITSLASPAAGFASQSLVKRLREDRWPIVRASASIALGRHAASAEIDEALGKATEDASAFVRAPAVAALGNRRATSQSPRIRARLVDDDEAPEVRTSAAEALGQLCDREAIEPLTKAALRLTDPMLPAELRGVSLTALNALARIGPADLKQRLARLLAAEAPLAARIAAEAALRARPGCGRGKR